MMRRLCLLFAAPLFFGAASSSAAGINLAWNDCGAFGTFRETFACDTNVGSHVLVGSFVAPQMEDAMSGNTIALDLLSACAAVPDWWQTRTGLCRATSLSSSFDFTASPGNCLDYWEGGAIGALVMDPPSGKTARIRGSFALPSGDSRIVPIAEGTEVYSFKVVFNNAKTVGPAACQGCLADMCFLLQSIRLDQPTAGSIMITNPAMSSAVSWQHGGIVYPDFTNLPPFCIGDCPTPTRARTWGSIKALYR
jgi:hypothetical protein